LIHIPSLVPVLVLASLASAGTWVRHNVLGTPPGPARVTVLADSSRMGAAWTLLSPTGSVAATGTLPATRSGIGGYNPKPYGTVVDLDLLQSGTWKWILPGTDTTLLQVAQGRWSFLAMSAVRHLRLMRSGPNQSLFRAPSHLGDTSCPVMVPDGPWSEGAWKAHPTGRKVRALGGWYDAGDQIKFTLTTAYTTYHLLRAWQANPGIHGTELSTSGLPDLLEEARHGLDYLAPLMVDDTTFIVQVGDGLDHKQGNRLPQFDALEGKRPALVALSPMPMGYTAAALALGSRVFASRDTARANLYRRQALAIQAAMARPSAAREAAFYRDQVNDFYADPTPWDNLALMEHELFRLLGDSVHLRRARMFADSGAASFDPGWTEVGLTVDLDLAADHAPSRTRVGSAMTQFTRFATTTAPLWGIPFAPSWGPLLGWPIAGAEAFRQARVLGDTSGVRMARDILDYALGRNNWGVSFVMSRHVPKSVRNIYGPIYALSDEFPEGAVAEGPGSRATHNSLTQYFSIPTNSPEVPFNTSSVVFFDHASDFQTMETTISQQGTFLYFLSEAARAVGDTVVGIRPSPILDPDEAYLAGLVARPVPLSASNWMAYDDQSEQGISTVELLTTGDSTGKAVFRIAIGEVLDYGYAGMYQDFNARAMALPWKDAVGVRVHYDLPAGRTVRLQVRSSAVKDYDEFGATIPGRGATTTTVLFKDMAQQGFGAALASFAPATATAIEFLANSVADSLPLHVRKVEILTEPSSSVRRARVSESGSLRVRGNRLEWTFVATRPSKIELVSADGSRSTLAQGNLPEAGSLALPTSGSMGWIRVVTGSGTRTMSLPPFR
jgi:endoglucanase